MNDMKKGKMSQRKEEGKKWKETDEWLWEERERERERESERERPVEMLGCQMSHTQCMCAGIIIIIIIIIGARGSVLVNALCYKPENRWFETR
jgi:hypothetical protein